MAWMGVESIMRQSQKTAIISVALLAFILIAGCGTDNNVTPPGGVNVNRVWIDAVTAMSSDSDVKVDVWFANIIPLSGLEVPLAISGSGFTIDSASFKSSRLSEDILAFDKIMAPRQAVVISAVWDGSTPIDSGEGLLASLYFSLDSESRGQVLEIDSVTIDDSPGPFRLRYLHGNPLEELVPEFIKGEISVLQ